ncbi:uncharacterized protein LOC135156176 [Lytechinus pictus]|uniref:uncharacterized protein LOC129260650 n=1 Tax=Lytechinus pictus TaxID=7653 RepID=UPI0030BA275D
MSQGEGDMNSRNMEVMAQVFKKALGLGGILPPGKLSKFRGSPQRSGEPSLGEWLEEFDDATSGMGLNESEKTKVFLDHLVGAAKDEIMCLPESSKGKLKEMKDALRLCFGQNQSSHSLSSIFFSRTQQEDETLADFSRALKKLYGRMENAAVSQEESEALKKLKDKSLCEQFTQGAREVWVKRELRRIFLSKEKENFEEMRKEALLLFQDATEPARRARVREAIVEEYAVQTSTPKLNDVLDQQKLLIQEITYMREEMSGLRTIVKDLKSPNRSRRKPFSEIVCYRCKQKGHYKSSCPQTSTTSYELSQTRPTTAEN